MDDMRSVRKSHSSWNTSVCPSAPPPPHDWNVLVPNWADGKKGLARTTSVSWSFLLPPISAVPARRRKFGHLPFMIRIEGAGIQELAIVEVSFIKFPEAMKTN
eukprot:scaffold627_cov125-Cylindrotheca_fusiformis.AAC.1